VVIALARVLLPLAAILTWRWSRLVSGALGFAFVASLVYLVAPWEPLRWVSAVTGLAGVTELGRVRGISGLLARSRVGVRDRRMYIMNRRDIVAALLVGSMAADGVAYLWHRSTGHWGPMPVLQVVVLAAMCVIGAWPRRWSWQRNS